MGEKHGKHMEAHGSTWNEVTMKDVPVEVESQMNVVPTMADSAVVLKIHEGEEHRKRAKNATRTGAESIGIKAMMEIFTPKS
jgi:hypothetical protein